MAKTAAPPAPRPQPGSPSPSPAPSPAAAPEPLLTAPLPGGPPAAAPDHIRNFEPAPFDIESAGAASKEIPPQPGPTPSPKADDDDPERRSKENDSLRTQMAERNKLLTQREQELADRQRELDEERRNIESLRRERDGLSSERDKLRTDFETFRKNAEKIDPMTDPDIQRMNREFDGSVETLEQDIAESGGKAGKLRQLIPQLLGQYKGIGKSDSQGFEDRRDEFNQTLQENFPDHQREVRNLLKSGLAAQQKIFDRIQEIEKDGEKYRSNREHETFRKAVEHYEQLEREYFNPSADVRQNDPFNAEVICAELFGLSDETKAGKTALLKFVREVILPQQPINQADLDKMQPEDQKRYLLGRQESRAALQAKIHKLLPTAIASMQFLPGVYKKMMEYKKQLEDARLLTPPPPSGEDEPTPRLEDEPKNIKDFKPTNTLLSEINTGR